MNPVEPLLKPNPRCSLSGCLSSITQYETKSQTKAHDMKTKNATLVHRRWRTHASVLLTSLLCLTAPAAFAPSQASAQTIEAKASDVASETKEKIEDAGKTAAGKLDQLWRRIDEARLKNRTSDEIVAWLICGLLVGGLLSRTTQLRSWRPFVFGLIGAFLGGIVAHVTQLDLGLGPVLVRYEDLLFSLAGGVLVILGARRFLARKKNPT